MKSSSAAYRQTDEVRTIAYSTKYAKNNERKLGVLVITFCKALKRKVIMTAK
jgi:hypothetical protein